MGSCTCYLCYVRIVLGTRLGLLLVAGLMTFIAFSLSTFFSLPHGILPVITHPIATRNLSLFYVCYDCFHQISIQ